MSSPTPRSASLPLRLLLGYGVGSLGTGIFSTVPGLLLLYFLTDTLGVPAAMAGWAVFLPKAWDAAIDPWIGSLSDRTRSRWGRRSPWLLAGTLLLPPAFVALFTVPALPSPLWSFGWVLVFFGVSATAFACFQVPYIALPAEITRTAHERTVLMSWRMVFMFGGVLAGGAAAPLLVQAGGGGRPGYATMASVLAAACFAAWIVTFATTRGLGFAPEHEGGLDLRSVLRHRPFTVLMTAFLLQMAAASVLLATVPYLARYLLGGDARTVTRLFVSLIVPCILSMPLWVALERRSSRLACYRASVVLFAVAAASLAAADAQRIDVLTAQVALMGVGWGGTQLFPFSLLPDTIDADTARSGRLRAGAFTGVWMAGEKVAMAGGALLAGSVLALSGFVASTGATVIQPDSALAGIRVALGAVPAALLLLSLGVLQAFRPTDLAGAAPRPGRESGPASCAAPSGSPSS